MELVQPEWNSVFLLWNIKKGSIFRPSPADYEKSSIKTTPWPRFHISIDIQNQTNKSSFSSKANVAFWLVSKLLKIHEKTLFGFSFYVLLLRNPVMNFVISFVLNNHINVILSTSWLFFITFLFSVSYRIVSYLLGINRELTSMKRKRIGI